MSGIGYKSGAPRLTIDLSAICENYKTLSRMADPVPAAAVLKADGYGLGAVPVAQALWKQGCRFFFTAHLNEAIQLWEALPNARIAILNGLMPGEDEIYRHHNLLPVLNDLGQVQEWAQQHPRRHSLLQLDSGMSRLGLPPEEVQKLASDSSLLARLNPLYAISHLACADDPAHARNIQQLDRFRQLRKQLPDMPASLAASAGIALGPDWHFDLVRPGVALFGGQPSLAQKLDLKPVVRLQAPILQIREVPAGSIVGYSASYQTEKPTRIATLALGYADGYARALSNIGSGYHNGRKLPVIGRVSMDMITLDVTMAPDLTPGSLINLTGQDQDINLLARQAGSIPHEILTSLGRRFDRVYVS